ncbi:MAG: hypothetical protein H7Y38_14270 [Armatimonadetes bacterium]|nr:hypothetical protein [Armatimonadota bacterium]
MTIGVLIGVVVAFLLVITKRTPPEKRRATYLRATRDALRLARLRYGVVAAPLFGLADHFLTHFDADNTAPSEKPG